MTPSRSIQVKSGSRYLLIAALSPFSKAVIKAVVDAADARRNNRDYRDRGYVSPRVVVAAPYYYDPYYYYDPFWYRPSFSLGFSFGGYGYRGYRGGHFGGGYRGGHGHR